MNNKRNATIKAAVHESMKIILLLLLGGFSYALSVGDFSHFLIWFLTITILTTVAEVFIHLVKYHARARRK